MASRNPSLLQPAARYRFLTKAEAAALGISKSAKRRVLKTRKRITSLDQTVSDRALRQSELLRRLRVKEPSARKGPTLEQEAARRLEKGAKQFRRIRLAAAAAVASGEFSAGFNPLAKTAEAKEFRRKYGKVASLLRRERAARKRFERAVFAAVDAVKAGRRPGHVGLKPVARKAKMLVGGKAATYEKWMRIITESDYGENEAISLYIKMMAKYSEDDDG